MPMLAPGSSALVLVLSGGFLCGLLFGSFLNVCISRLPDHRSIIRPRSHCPHCGHVLNWYDNIPLLSWVLLRGRCRACNGPISWRYPAVELAVGLWFAFVLHSALAAAQHGPSTAANDGGLLAGVWIGALALAVLGFLLLGLLVMDWQTHVLPDTFTLTGTLLGFLFVCMEAVFLPYGVGDIKLNPGHSLRMSSPGSFAAKGNVFLSGTETLVFGRLAAIAGAALLLLAIRFLYFSLRGRKHSASTSNPDGQGSQARFGLGLGDVKLLAMIAAFLGFWSAILALFVGVVSCSLYATTLLASRRATALSRLPLGSFLAFGGLLAAVFGDRWIAWYASLL